MASSIFASSSSRGLHSSRLKLPQSIYSSKPSIDGGHQLEKLEFALAISQTKGDNIKSDLLRTQIAELAGNFEEPGT